MSPTNDYADIMDSIFSSSEHHTSRTPEARRPNDSQAEIITQLQIRIAVLESEAKRARQDKDAFTSILPVFIGALNNNRYPIQAARDFSNSQEVQYLERLASESPGPTTAHRQEKDIIGLKDEIERLRKTNKSLSRQLREKVKPSPSENYGDRTTTLPLGTQRDHNLSDADGQMHSLLGSHHRSAEPPISTVDHTPVVDVFRGREGRPGQSEFKSQSPQVDKSFTSNTATTTTPNTPILTSKQSVLSTIDFGMQALDDVIGDDDEDYQHTQEKKLLVAQLLKTNTVKPGVIQTGIEADGIVRGRVYDDEAAEDTRLGMGSGRFGRWGTRDYNRFGPPSLPFGQYSLSTNNSSFIGSHTSSEIPKELSGDGSLWKSPQEREDAIDLHSRYCEGRQMRIFPQLFRYGVQYVPDEDDQGNLRAVRISNLPKNVEVRDVLERIRGGAIASVILCDTWKLTGGMSALVEFKFEHSATDYVDYVALNPINFNDDDNPRNAEVILIPTPTYPPVPNKFSGERTRCINIYSFPPNLSFNALEHTIACGNMYRAKSLADFYIDQNGTLRLEFTSVSAAGSSYAILNSRQPWANLRSEFVRDPCAGAVEELMDDPKPRLPMFPRCEAVEKSENRILNDTSNNERKQLSALTNQKVEIPSFSGAQITSSSWADEVNEESSPSPSLSPPFASSVTSSAHSKVRSEKATENNKGSVNEISADLALTANTITMPDINRALADKDSPVWKDRQIPSGLSSSRFATGTSKIEEKGSRSGHRAPRNSLSEVGKCWVTENNGFVKHDGSFELADHTERFTRKKIAETNQSTILEEVMKRSRSEDEFSRLLRENAAAASNQSTNPAQDSDAGSQCSLFEPPEHSTPTPHQRPSKKSSTIASITGILPRTVNESSESQQKVINSDEIQLDLSDHEEYTSLPELSPPHSPVKARGLSPVPAYSTALHQSTDTTNSKTEKADTSTPATILTTIPTSPKPTQHETIHPIMKKSAIPPNLSERSLASLQPEVSTPFSPLEGWGSLGVGRSTSEVFALGGKDVSAVKAEKEDEDTLREKSELADNVEA